MYNSLARSRRPNLLALCGNEDQLMLEYMGFIWRVLCLAALSSGFGGAAAAQTAPRPSLMVTPPSSVNISGPEGGPFSPGSIQYRLSASTGTIRFAIMAPFWLTADRRLGTVGIDSVTVTLSLNERASKLSPQAYEAPVTFINVTNGQGTTRRSAKLTVEPSSRGYLLDGSGGYLLGNPGERLLSR